MWDYRNLLFARNCICLNHSSLSSLSSLREWRLDRGFDPDFINNKKWIEPLCSVPSVFCHTTRNYRAKTGFDAVDYQSVLQSWRKNLDFSTIWTELISISPHLCNSQQTPVFPHLNWGWAPVKKCWRRSALAHINHTASWTDQSGWVAQQIRWILY